MPEALIHQPAPAGRPLPHDWAYGIIVTKPWNDGKPAPPFVVGYVGITPRGRMRVALNAPEQPFFYSKFDTRLEAELYAASVKEMPRRFGLKPDANLTATVILLPDHNA